MSLPLRPSAATSVSSRALLARGFASPAVVALAIYTFLLISRLPELFPLIGLIRPIMLLTLLTVALAWALPLTQLGAVVAAPESRAALGMFILVLAGVPTSYWPSETFNFGVMFFPKTLLFFFLLLYCIRSLKELRCVVLAFVGSIAALELGVIFLNVKERARVTGSYDPNDLAFVMVCAIPVAVMLLQIERGLWRHAMIPVVMLGLVAIIMTKSRGGFISLLVVGAIILAKLPSRVWLGSLGLLIAAIVVFSVFAPQSYWDRVGSMWQDAEAREEVGADGYVKEGFSPRWRLWMRGIDLMLEHPFLGVGAGAFAIAEGGETFRDGGWRGYLGAHNSFIQVGAELGMLGIGLFVYLLYRTIRNYRMVIRTAGTRPHLRYHLWTAHGFETATYGYIIAGSALNQGFSAILYFLVGMSVVLKWRTLRDRAELDSGESRQPDAGGSVPWWKAPR